ncbi:uncharacterized protein LOC108033706 [Drosophila biarmipes]|uniref:uncharacterized protein LOC108033706 n=1 Tax=Drosophila biarmipes TaxID=125945 RepID=UPI0007E62C25|nr:uncharacterized protein LOC108033706 [Drosophila biarmipes]
MSDKDKQDVPEQFDDTSQENASQEDFIDEASQALPDPNAESISASPSILRPITTPRRDVSDAPSIVLLLPDNEMDTLPEETEEQRQRRRMRFLELRREHYNHVHHSEQCTMSDTDDEDRSENQPKSQEQKKPQ